MKTTEGRVSGGSQESPLQCRCCRSAACCVLIHTVFLHNQVGEMHTQTHISFQHCTRRALDWENVCVKKRTKQDAWLKDIHPDIHFKTERERERWIVKWSVDQKYWSPYVAILAYVSTWNERRDRVFGGYSGCFLHASCFFSFVIGKNRSLSRAWDSAHMIRILPTLLGLWSKSFARSWGG